MSPTSYSGARKRLAQIWDELEDSREEVMLQRRGHEDLALLPARDLRPPRNAVRLLKVLARSCRVGGVEFESVDDLAAPSNVNQG